MFNHSQKILILALAVIVCHGSIHAQSTRQAQGVANQQAKHLNQEALTPRQIADRTLQSTVLVVTQDKEGESISQGSGFFFGDGFVATNLHVFKRASRGYIKLLNSDRKYEISEVVGFDLIHDLCIFKVNNVKAPSLFLGSSVELSVGDDVYVAGNPKGLEGSLSKGIVSALRRDRQLVQIDAAISPGSSGGPVVDTRGHVVGVAAASLIGGQNLNFAIPIEYLARIKMKWVWPVSGAGGLAVNEIDRQHLEGSVRKVITSEAEYKYDENSDHYFEKEREVKRIDTYGFSGEAREAVIYPSRDTFHLEYSELGCANRIVVTKANGSEQVFSNLTEYECFSQKAEAGNFSTTKTYSPSDGSAFSKTFDRDGNEIQEIKVTQDKKFTTRTETSYDENGNPVEQKVFSNEKPQWVFQYKYEYDRYGNWIKKIKYRLYLGAAQTRFRPDGVTYREITYYER